jgi:hypothetical protein
VLLTLYHQKRFFAAPTRSLSGLGRIRLATEFLRSGADHVFSNWTVAFHTATLPSA